MQLQIRRRGFDGEEGTLLSKPAQSGDSEVSTAGDGDKGKFNRIAFITVRVASQPKARIPVALTDNGVILLPVPSVNEENTLALERASIYRQCPLSSMRGTNLRMSFPRGGGRRNGLGSLPSPCPSPHGRGDAVAGSERYSGSLLP